MRRTKSGPIACDSTPRSPDLVDRLVAHEEAAYEELVRMHGPRMRAVAAHYLAEPADAEDALQDSYVSVVRSIGGFERASQLDTWLHRVVVNCALGRLRRRHRKPETPLGKAALDEGSSSPWHGPGEQTAYETLASAELRDLVRREVDRLPESQRSTLLLRDLEGLELREIASLLDVGLSTVKVRLHRARHALHDALEPRL